MFQETSFDALFGTQIPNPAPPTAKSVFSPLLALSQRFLKFESAVEYHAQRIEKATQEFLTSEGN